MIKYTSFLMVSVTFFVVAISLFASPHGGDPDPSGTVSSAAKFYDGNSGQNRAKWEIAPDARSAAVKIGAPHAYHSATLNSTFDFTCDPDGWYVVQLAVEHQTKPLEGEVPAGQPVVTLQIYAHNEQGEIVGDPVLVQLATTPDGAWVPATTLPFELLTQFKGSTLNEIGFGLYFEATMPNKAPASTLIRAVLTCRRER